MQEPQRKCEQCKHTETVKRQDERTDVDVILHRGCQVDSVYRRELNDKEVSECTSINIAL